MFTGIIATTGRVRSIAPKTGGARLLVDPGDWHVAPRRGDSICVNGVCLTHAPADGNDGMLRFDIITETLSRSNLGALSVGDRVNLEASLTPDTPMGGHFVQGHVDGLGTVADIRDTAQEWRLTTRIDRTLMPFMVPKGSVAIDGISLTIASVDVAANTFDVAIIPTTLDVTNLGDRKIGDRLNIETDMIVRSVVHVLRHFSEDADGLTMEKLRAAGFGA